MADYNARLLAPHTILAGAPASIPAQLVSGGGSPVGASLYLMIWSDPDCGSPTARYWYATFEDTTGTEYTGPKCGATPIADASVLKQIVPS